ncbi:MAG: hypothetical protein ACYCX4_17825 [Bacillota bacterium]
MEDQIALLRKISTQQDIRKKIIGGFSEEDVTAYVNNIYEHFQQIENEYKQNIEKLQSSNSELELQLESHLATEKDVDSLMQNIIELEDALKQSQHQVQEEQKIKEQIETERRADSARYNDTITMLEAKVSELEEQEQQLRSEHDTIVKALEDKLNKKNANPINNIHAMLDQLKDQVTDIDNLQQQVEHERIRAEKAEREMSQYWKWVSVIKERFHKDQLELELQFTEIEEQYTAMHAHVNGLRTNLENFRLITEVEIEDLSDGQEA